MNGVAYEKGAAFLQTVESIVGRARLDAFLRDYFDRFAFQPMSSTRLVAFMNEKLLQPGEADRIDIQKWIFEPGVPPNAPPVQSEALAAVDAQVATWKNGGATSALQTTKWSTQEWLHFLRALPETVPSARLAELDRAFAFSQSGNSEILFAWLKIAIRIAFSRRFPRSRSSCSRRGASNSSRPCTRISRRRTGVGRWRSTSTGARVPPTISSRRIPSTRR